MVLAVKNSDTMRELWMAMILVSSRHVDLLLKLPGSREKEAEGKPQSLN